MNARAQLIKKLANSEHIYVHRDPAMGDLFSEKNPTIEVGSIKVGNVHKCPLCGEKFFQILSDVEQPDWVRTECNVDAVDQRLTKTCFRCNKKFAYSIFTWWIGEEVSITISVAEIPFGDD